MWFSFCDVVYEILVNLCVFFNRLLRQISDIKQSMEMVEYLEASQVKNGGFCAVRYLTD